MSDPEELFPARAILDDVLSEVEDAASRFKAGTEIEAVNAAAGRGPIEISPMMVDLVAHALFAAELTAGACDPTVSESLLALGYDADFDSLDPSRPVGAVAPSPGISGIVLDAAHQTLSLPAGTTLDLGATAKARAADLAAERIAAELGVGVLVDIGGDLRASGPVPPGGWPIGVTRSARDEGEIAEVVCIESGGVASSSSVVRTWTREGTTMHHIIDPETGRSASTPFAMVTVVASTCVEANAYATAGIVWGEDALFELPQRSMVARVERLDGTVERLGGWPEPIEVPA